MIYTDTLAMAGAAEEMLIEAIRPPWNEKALSGFGSRDPGSTRCEQRPSGFDCLHQRDWVQAPTTDEKAAAKKALKAYLSSGYVRAIWPELNS